jgi:hypothetical protein
MSCWLFAVVLLRRTIKKKKEKKHPRIYFHLDRIALGSLPFLLSSLHVEAKEKENDNDNS